ncbi:MAG: MBG domain-containing protein, partial [Deltaproteobacteria bacterium]
ATAAVGGSPYAVTPSDAVGTGLDNYTLSYVDGALTIAPKALDITANDLTKTYGDTLAFTGQEFTASGLVNADTVDSVSLASDGAAADASVGDYDIAAGNASGSGLSNYAITYHDGTLTVSALPLVLVTANDATKTYGDTLTFAGTEFVVNGLVNNDTVDSVTLTSGGAAADADAGSYAIVPSDAAGSGLENYTISYQNGILTVAKADATIDVTGFSGVYDGLAHGATGTAAGVGGVDLSGWLDLGSSFTGVPGGTADWTFSGGTNYNDASGSVAVTITPKALSITADDATKAYGDTLIFAGTEFTASGLVNNDTVDSVTLTSGGAAQGASAGTYEILVSNASGTGLSNYAISYHNGTLAVSRPPAALDGAAYDQLRYKLPYLEQLVPHQINPFDLISSTDLTGPVYFYHPLVEANMSAYDAFTLEEGAYRFIDQNINIVGHEGLLPILEETRKKNVPVL